MRPTDAEIRQFAAARKRPASGAGPSRPSKRPAPVPPTVEASATEGSEPIIALAAPTVRVEERPTEEVAEGVSAVSPPRVEPDVVREAEHRPEASAGATGGAGLPDVGLLREVPPQPAHNRCPPLWRVQVLSDRGRLPPT